MIIFKFFLMRTNAALPILLIHCMSSVFSDIFPTTDISKITDILNDVLAGKSDFCLGYY